MSTLSILLYAFAGICVAGLVDLFLTRRRARLSTASRRRLRDMASRLHDSENEGLAGTILRDSDENLRMPLASKFDQLPFYHGAALLLYRAGIESPVWRFGLFSLALGGIATWAFTLVFFRLDWALTAGLLAVCLPWLFAARRKRQRMLAFEQQLPEALDLMCRALRAGHGFTSGLKMVADELEAPIGPEFAHVADEIALGLETRDAMKNLIYRIDVEDLHFMSTSVLIQRETGGNLAEVMDRLAHVIRERHRLARRRR